MSLTMIMAMALAPWRSQIKHTSGQWHGGEVTRKKTTAQPGHRLETRLSLSPTSVSLKHIIQIELQYQTLSHVELDLL